MRAQQRRAQANWDKDPMSVDRMMAEMAKALPSNTIIADEAVTSRGAMLGALDFDEPGCMHAIQGGGLGWAMGGALGIKLAHPDRLWLRWWATGRPSTPSKPCDGRAVQHPGDLRNLQQPHLQDSQAEHGHIPAGHA